jgi:hypothetical protein
LRIDWSHPPRRADVLAPCAPFTSGHHLAEQRHRQDVANARAELDRLPVISLDPNVVAAGVNAIMPVADAWVDRGVVVLWVLLFCVAPCAFLRLGLAILAPARWGRA